MYHSDIDTHVWKVLSNSIIVTYKVNYSYKWASKYADRNFLHLAKHMLTLKLVT